MIRKKPKIGIIAMGHEAYWSQFEGLKEELSVKSADFAGYFNPEKAEIVMLDFADGVDKSFEAVKECKRADLDALFIVLTTYVTSSTAMPFAVYLDIPQVLVGIQPLDRLDYKNTTTYMQLANDDICAMPEIAGVYSRFGRKTPHMLVSAYSRHEEIQKQVDIWQSALCASIAFKYSTIGYLGHTYEGMYDMHTDPGAVTRTLGCHVKMLEMCELAEYVEGASGAQVEEKTERIRNLFDIMEPSGDSVTDYVAQSDIEWAARCACGLDTLIERNNLSALAYYYAGRNGNLYERIASSLIIGNTLLTSSGIPLSGEADLKTAVSMLVMDRIGGGGSFAELHPFDVTDDIILIGHDGPHNITISEGRPIIRRLKKFHGKQGSGISVEFSLKVGAITLLSTSLSGDGRLKMVACVGESVKGEIPRTGNTNTRCTFPYPVTEFVRRWCAAGPTHHLALGIGDRLEEIRLFCEISGIPLTVV
ncbi:MAG: hypothetical protein AB9835_02935 [Eubacteriales bacterium]